MNPHHPSRSSRPLAPEGGLVGVFIQAVEAAARRSRELSEE
ncbi:MAG: hypothetical protein ACYC66_13350 [Chloroflexota bacterium]